MRRQCQLVKIQEGQIQHKGDLAVTVRLYTHVNKHRPHAAAFRAGHPLPGTGAVRLVWQWFKGMKEKVGKRYGQVQGTTGAPSSA
jgi:hypothetical protein